MNIVDKARKFAELAHEDQKRKYTGEPYFVHLDEVAKLCARHGLSKRACAAAYLHDTIEDQPVTFRELETKFGKDVAGVVYELTDQPAVNRRAKCQASIERLARASSEAQSVKCADIVSNTTSIAKHDPDFARTYLPEIRAMLVVLTRAKPELRALAYESLVQAERKIDA